MREIRNAVIKSTFLGREDHGITTAMLYLDYGGAGQGFGGYGLGKSAFGIAFIERVLDTLGVASWEKLPATHLRADAEHGKVHRIGHILEDRWFDPVALAAEMHNEVTP